MVGAVERLSDLDVLVRLEQQFVMERLPLRHRIDDLLAQRSDACVASRIVADLEVLQRVVGEGWVGEDD
jgi:predicted nucleotidyltransferase